MSRVVALRRLRPAGPAAQTRETTSQTTTSPVRRAETRRYASHYTPSTLASLKQGLSIPLPLPPPLPTRVRQPEEFKPSFPPMSGFVDNGIKPTWKRNSLADVQHNLSQTNPAIPSRIIQQLRRAVLVQIARHPPVGLAGYLSEQQQKLRRDGDVLYDSENIDLSIPTHCLNNFMKTRDRNPRDAYIHWIQTTEADVGVEGENIWVFCHSLTKQVIYSLKNTLVPADLAKLTYVGKKSIDPVLRPDHWRCICSIAFPNPHQGLHAYAVLREFRLRHEHEWVASKERGTLDALGKLPPKPVLTRMLQNQKANSIADIAATLAMQQKMGEKQMAEWRWRWEQWDEQEAKTLEKTQRLADQLNLRGHVLLEERAAKLEDELETMEPEARERAEREIKNIRRVIPEIRAAPGKLAARYNQKEQMRARTLGMMRHLGLSDEELLGLDKWAPIKRPSVINKTDIPRAKKQQRKASFLSKRRGKTGIQSEHWGPFVAEMVSRCMDYYHYGNFGREMQPGMGILKDKGPLGETVLDKLFPMRKPIYSLHGVEILWAEQSDREHAFEWPEEVTHHFYGHAMYEGDRYGALSVRRMKLKALQAGGIPQLIAAERKWTRRVEKVRAGAVEKETMTMRRQAAAELVRLARQQEKGVKDKVIAVPVLTRKDPDEERAIRGGRAIREEMEAKEPEPTPTPEQTTTPEPTTTPEHTPAPAPTTTSEHTFTPEPESQTRWQKARRFLRDMPKRFPSW